MTPRRLTPADLPAVADLEKDVFFAPWSVGSLALLCTDRAFGYGIFDETGRALSYAGMLTVLDEGQITNVATREEARRRGYAVAVLSALLDEAKRRGVTVVTLEVRASNAPALTLYRRFGFEKAGERPHFYNHPDETALVLSRRLTGASEV